MIVGLLQDLWTHRLDGILRCSAHRTDLGGERRHFFSFVFGEGDLLGLGSLFNCWLWGRRHSFCCHLLHHCTHLSRGHMHLSVKLAVSLTKVVHVPLWALLGDQSLQILDQAFADFLDKCDDLAVVVRRHVEREQRHLTVELLSQALQLLHLRDLDEGVGRLFIRLRGCFLCRSLC